MRRSDICLYLGSADRAEMRALIAKRNTSRKLVWRAEIVLATGTGMSKPTVWRRQERYLDEGVRGSSATRRGPLGCRLCPERFG